MEKKVVHYRGGKATDVQIGMPTILNPVDHPDTENVSNLKPVITTAVVAWNKETGRVETRNTIYIPEEN